MADPSVGPNMGLVGLLASLGPSAAAVAVAYLFIRGFTDYMKSERERALERDQKIMALFGEIHKQVELLVTDIGMVLRQHTAALADLSNLVRNQLNASHESR